MRKEILPIYDKYKTTGTSKWNFMVASHDLVYQVGCLTKLLMQLQGFRHREGKEKEDLLTEIGDELADIIAEVVFIADELEIDLDNSWSEMINSDLRKIDKRRLINKSDNTQ